VNGSISTGGLSFNNKNFGAPIGAPLGFGDTITVGSSTCGQFWINTAVNSNSPIISIYSTSITSQSLIFVNLINSNLAQPLVVYPQTDPNRIQLVFALPNGPVGLIGINWIVF
jgi:hypothetical protein